MDFPTESSLLSAIGRLRAIRKHRLEIRKEDAALEAEEAARIWHCHASPRKNPEMEDIWKS